MKTREIIRKLITSEGRIEGYKFYMILFKPGMGGGFIPCIAHIKPFVIFENTRVKEENFHPFCVGYLVVKHGF